MIANLFIPHVLPGINEIIKAAKSGPCVYSALKARWTDCVWAYAKQARLPRFNKRVFVSYLFVEPNRRRDPDNFTAGGHKIILDGLRKAGVIANDGWRQIAASSDKWMIGEKHGVYVVITDQAEVHAAMAKVPRAYAMVGAPRDYAPLTFVLDE